MKATCTSRAVDSLRLILAGGIADLCPCEFFFAK